MKIKPCKYCGQTNHYSLMCFQKPKKVPKHTSEKTLNKKQECDRLWYEQNPPDEKGLWYCYLNISPLCPYWLTRSTITLEHVKSKVRYPQLKYDINNLKPACTYCNAEKGSLDLEDLVLVHPHLQAYI